MRNIVLLLSIFFIVSNMNLDNKTLNCARSKNQTNICTNKKITTFLVNNHHQGHSLQLKNTNVSSWNYLRRFIFKFTNHIGFCDKLLVDCILCRENYRTASYMIWSLMCSTTNRYVIRPFYIIMESWNKRFVQMCAFAYLN